MVCLRGQPSEFIVVSFARRSPRRHTAISIQPAGHTLRSSDSWQAFSTQRKRKPATHFEWRAGFAGIQILSSTRLCGEVVFGLFSRWVERNAGSTCLVVVPRIKGWMQGGGVSLPTLPASVRSWQLRQLRIAILFSCDVYLPDSTLEGDHSLCLLFKRCIEFEGQHQAAFIVVLHDDVSVAV
jgi:hypothetical protein